MDITFQHITITPLSGPVRSGCKGATFQNRERVRYMTGCDYADDSKSVPGNVYLTPGFHGDAPGAFTFFPAPGHQSAGS